MKVAAVLAGCALLAGCAGSVSEPAATTTPQSLSAEVGPENREIFDIISAVEDATGGVAFDLREQASGYLVRTYGDGQVTEVLVGSDGELKNPPRGHMLFADDESGEKARRVGLYLDAARISLADAIDAAASSFPGHVSAAKIASAGEDLVRFDVLIEVDGETYELSLDGVTGRFL